MTLAELQTQLERLDDGVLKCGMHAPGHAFCALEFESQVRGRDWSDEPVTLPDLRPLNDGPWSSDQARTNALLPVMVALWDWAEWPASRQQRWIERVVIHTVVQIVADLPGLSDGVRERCRSVTTLVGARTAARAAAQEAAPLPSSDSAAAAARAAGLVALIAITARIPRTPRTARAMVALAQSLRLVPLRPGFSFTPEEVIAEAARTVALVSELAAVAPRPAWYSLTIDKLLLRACTIWIAAAEGATS